MKLELDQVSAQHPAARPDAPLALHGLTLRVEAGEAVAVIGPSGAGKTSLLALLACALKPQTGQLLIGGFAPWQLSTAALQRRRRQLFLLPQTPPLPPRQRVVTAVLAGRLAQQSLWASLRSLVYPTDIAAAHAALAQFDVEGKLFARVDRLSGGERQRVALAQLLLAQARLWLVDEPLSALDPARAAQAIAVLIDAAAQRDATLICGLHQVEIALLKFGRIIGLRAGGLVFDRPAAQVTAAMIRDLYATNTAA